jgi:hypothetical protein
VHIVAQVDLDSVKSALSTKLQSQVAQKLQKELTTDEVMVGSPVYGVSVSASTPVGTQVDKVTVLVEITGSVTTYNSNVASRTAEQLLSRQAIQTLGDSYQLQGLPSVSTPLVVDPGKDGIVYLSVSVHGTWVYTLTPQQMSQWRQFIKGATSQAALAYINTQTGVAAVQIHLPFGTDHLPTSVDDIRVVLVSSDGTA